MQEKTTGLVDSVDMEKAQPFFPLFVSLSGKRAVIVGGGNTAYGRAKTLLRFGAHILVIAPEISEDMSSLVRENKASWLQSEFTPQLLEGADIAVIATNLRNVNRVAGKAAKRMRILVNVADCREESVFLFPAVLQNEHVVVGAVSNDNDNTAVKKILKKIREMRGKSH